MRRTSSMMETSASNNTGFAHKSRATAAVTPPLPATIKWDNNETFTLNMSGITQSAEPGNLLDLIPMYPDVNGSSNSILARLAAPSVSCLHCDHPCTNTSLCHGAIGCYSSASVDASSEGVRHNRGCIASSDMVRLFCLQSQHHTHSALISFNCCPAPRCNNGSFPRLPDSSLLASHRYPTLADATDMSSYGGGGGNGGYYARLTVAALSPVVALLLVAALVAAVWWWRGRRGRHHKSHATSRAPAAAVGGTAGVCDTALLSPCMMSSGGSSGGMGRGDLLNARQPGESTLRDIVEMSMTSGSGSGLPLLVQRTLAKEVSLCELVGRGRYGEVWRGSWHGDSVAVKVFYSRDEVSWRRETQIYNTVMLRHANILGYLGSDLMSRGSCTQLLLITHYCQHGSLYDYLSRVAAVSERQCVRLLLSAINGLSHLHTEVIGTQGKPAIAHRDVKTKNILVRSDGEAVIADLGLAVVQCRSTTATTVDATTDDASAVDATADVRVGTKRYMAPELLENRVNVEQFASLLQCDMYSFSLVMWETARRCRVSGRATTGRATTGRATSGCDVEPYRPAFYELVPPDPGYDHMRKVVCVDQQRPPITAHWALSTTLAIVAGLMRECWHHNAQARLTALRVKKSLAALYCDLTQSQQQRHLHNNLV